MISAILFKGIVLSPHLACVYQHHISYIVMVCNHSAALRFCLFMIFVALSISSVFVGVFSVFGSLKALYAIFQIVSLIGHFKAKCSIVCIV